MSAGSDEDDSDEDEGDEPLLAIEKQAKILDRKRYSLLPWCWHLCSWARVLFPSLQAICIVEHSCALNSLPG